MRYLSLIIILLVISGCSTKPRQGGPAPVIGRDGSESAHQAVKDGDVTITPLRAPAGIQAKPATNRAVELLHQRAHAQVEGGDLTAASKTLERALSIQPDDAQSWNLLAHLRAKQNKYAMAAEIAARSNTLVPAGQTALKKDNLLLIARMKAQMGDRIGAAQAKRQASLLN